MGAHADPGEYLGAQFAAHPAADEVPPHCRRIRLQLREFRRILRRLARELALREEPLLAGRVEEGE